MPAMQSWCMHCVSGICMTKFCKIGAFCTLTERPSLSGMHDIPYCTTRNWNC